MGLAPDAGGAPMSDETRTPDTGRGDDDRGAESTKPTTRTPNPALREGFLVILAGEPENQETLRRFGDLLHTMVGETVRTPCPVPMVQAEAEAALVDLDRADRAAGRRRYLRSPGQAGRDPARRRSREAGQGAPEGDRGAGGRSRGDDRRRGGRRGGDWTGRTTGERARPAPRPRRHPPALRPRQRPRPGSRQACPGGRRRRRALDPADRPPILGEDDAGPVPAGDLARADRRGEGRDRRDLPAGEAGAADRPTLPRSPLQHPAPRPRRPPETRRGGPRPRRGALPGQPRRLREAIPPGAPAGDRGGQRARSQGKVSPQTASRSTSSAPCGPARAGTSATPTTSAAARAALSTATGRRWRSPSSISSTRSSRSRPSACASTSVDRERRAPRSGSGSRQPGIASSLDRARAPSTPTCRPSALPKVCEPDAKGRQLLDTAFDRLGLTIRETGIILRVARTIADLAGAETAGAPHVAEAIQYRSLARRQQGPRAGKGQR